MVTKTVTKNSKRIIEDSTISVETMIDKKTDDKSNPKNYRPINLTYSVFKLIEKLIKGKMDRYLAKYNVINLFQSGFREKRQTLDNLSYLVESANQAKVENPRNKVCAVVFDKVWHNGLIFKMHKLSFPKKLGQCITNFLLRRKFYVKHFTTTQVLCLWSMLPATLTTI